MFEQLDQTFLIKNELNGGLPLIVHLHVQKDLHVSKRKKEHSYAFQPPTITNFGPFLMLIYV